MTPAEQRLAEEAWAGWHDQGVEFLVAAAGAGFLDHRSPLPLRLCSSITSYEFGTRPEEPSQWSPVSRLNFSLDSVWYGLQLAHETPRTCFQIEWLAAGKFIDGDLTDYDWYPPNPDGSFTDLGFARECFTEGQMLDIGYKCKPFDPPSVLPIEVWPMIGFRWQRFDITGSEVRQVKSGNEWLDPPFTYEGDVITFNQQYWIGYAGLQLRGRLQIPMLRPIVWTLQGDWGYTEAYDVRSPPNP